MLTTHENTRQLPSDIGRSIPHKTSLTKLDRLAGLNPAPDSLSSLVLSLFFSHRNGTFAFLIGVFSPDRYKCDVLIPTRSCRSSCFHDVSTTKIQHDHNYFRHCVTTRHISGYRLLRTDFLNIGHSLRPATVLTIILYVDTHSSVGLHCGTGLQPI